MPLVRECVDPGCRVLTMGAFCVEHEQAARVEGGDDNLVSVLSSQTRPSSSLGPLEVTEAKRV